jgi:molybdopterin molybdotransferase
MISLDDARSRIFGEIGVLEPADVALADALGLVLVEPVIAGEDVPPFANTAMDGFAVQSADTAGATGDEPVRLPVVATVAAGQVASRPLLPGEAMRIMTGAPVPEGADAVVMVELTEVAGDEVLVGAEVPVGNHIRPAGDDLRSGDGGVRRRHDPRSRPPRGAGESRVRDRAGAPAAAGRGSLHR